MIKKDEGLKRSIGVFGLSANIMNIMIGAGIFALPAVIAGIMGSASIFSYIFCGILIALIVLCFAEAGSKVNNTGGPYTYIETAFGDYAGFLAGIFASGSNILASAAVANALLNIIATFNPLFELTSYRVLSLLIVYVLLVTINVRGIKQGIGLVKINTLLKVIPLIVLVVLGFKNISVSNLHIETLPTLGQLGESSLILFFAFLGCETGLIVGGEIKNPKRTIPRSIFLSIGSVVVLYILIQTVSQGVLGTDLVNHKATPLAETAKISMGTFGYVLLTIGAAVSMFGMVSGDLLNSPRVMYALARDKVIPIKPLAKIHPKFATPYIAIIVHGFLVFLFASTGSFEQLVIIATSSILLLYLGVALSVIKLRKTKKSEAGEFKIPGGLTVPILSIGIIIYFLSNLSNKEMIATAVFIGLLSAIFFVIRFIKRKKTD
ncbi:APC family permease [Meridianimaribacter flavus]|uniref:Amino acid/polyamine/organocation transporter (APC superfamily) n=1 Tax=Meridianimaribacter flavus TaxID=571115 RepID=A0ABY2G2P6_9FLAO|nr:amino acid permease [Meridianimaribacter flavus]TDY07589.1 amino acid/polyamine/organocation transporter (APC superfamily) [Meridianimaribacter flavus]